MGLIKRIIQVDISDNTSCCQFEQLPILNTVLGDEYLFLLYRYIVKIIYSKGHPRIKGNWKIQKKWRSKEAENMSWMMMNLIEK